MVDLNPGLWTRCPCPQHRSSCSGASAPLPTGWEPQQSGNGHARGGSGCASHVPRVSGCTRLEDASTRVESQKGLSSRTAGTEGLSRFLRQLGWPWAGVCGCFRNPVPPAKAAKEKKTKEEKHSTQIYVSQVRRKELGSAARQADAPCADTRGRRCPRAALDSRGKGATRGPWSVWTVLGTSFIILCGHLTG